MSRTTPLGHSRWKSVLLAVVVAGGLGWLGLSALRPGSVSLVAASAGSGAGSTDSSPTTYRVARAALPVTVSVRGDLESSQNLSIASEVEGQATIIVLAAEGSRVKKGDVVCELDGSLLRDSLVNQEIATRQAETSFQNAVKTREIAEISVREYEEGTFPQAELAAINGIGSARTELKIAQDKVEYSDRMRAIGFVTEVQNRSDHLNLQRAQLMMEQAETKLNVLREYTRPRQTTNLKAAVDRALADELAKQVAASREREKEEKLRGQVAKTIMISPGDGIVVYANQEMMRGPGTQTPIQEGTTVRERQQILNIPDLSQMRVNAKVHESMVKNVIVGHPARIRIDALPGELLEGTVETVRQLPDPRQGGPGGESDIKIYTAYIRINNPPDSLRPGMSGDVDILVRQYADALVVPVQSVLQFSGRNHVYIDSPQGPQLREVALGPTNDQFVEVKQGLGEGEVIRMDPSTVAPDLGRQVAFALGLPDRAWDVVDGE